MLCAPSSSISRQVIVLLLHYPSPVSTSFLISSFEILQRELHSRNKKALEFIAKGWNALKEVDRVIDYCELNDKCLIPLLKTAKENFELALKLTTPIPMPGAALLVEAAEMGDPEAQYALGCHLRVENDYVQTDQQAFYHLEKAVDQLHPGALYLLGVIFDRRLCQERYCLSIVVLSQIIREAPKRTKKGVVDSLRWHHNGRGVVGYYIKVVVTLIQGHAGAAIAYGSLLLKGVEVPESVIKFSLKRGAAANRRGKNKGSGSIDPMEMERESFR
ncbi:hypothetical protein Fmac_005727 [Flemingia macrophylla]|uniref:Uncharacterized protein n=1 Tax=Flemingia macrophylla TaxID=520843 RepID=A0ABD1N8L2_9FABA